jgi:hypothetical protein
MDLPREIVWTILNHTDSMRDRVACMMASPRIDVEPLERVVCRMDGIDLGKLLKAGAPVRVLDAFIARHWPIDVRDYHLVAAACGDVPDAVDWVVDRVGDALAGWPLHPHPVPPVDDAPTLWAEAGRCHSRWGTSDRNRPQYAGPVVDAMCEAAHRDRPTVLERLLDRFPFNRESLQGHGLLDCLMRDAAMGGAVGVVAHLHAQRSTPLGSNRPCRCPLDVGTVAARANRPDVLALLESAKCQGRFKLDPLDRRTFEPIRDGLEATTRWLLSALDVASWPEPCHSISDALVAAAEKGHVAVLAAVEGIGAQRCPLEALVRAAAKGHLDVLRWAAGDIHVRTDAARPQGIDPCTKDAIQGGEMSTSDAVEGRRHVEAWPSLAIGQAAANEGHTNIVEWLAARPDARRTLDVGAARLALGRGHTDVASVLHDAGIAPFDQWDALYAAIRSYRVEVVRAVAYRPGVWCTSRAIEYALTKTGGWRVLDAVRERYGDGPVREAVPRLSGMHMPCQTVRWLSRCIPDLCLASALANPERSLYAGYCCRQLQDKDRCPSRCSCPACLHN